jgi:hypothetical protein
MDSSPEHPDFDEYVDKLARMDRITPAVEESIDKARAARFGHQAVFYVAGALTGVSESDKQRYAGISELAERHNRPVNGLFAYVPHLHGTDPVAHPDVSPGEVRDIDYLWSTVVAQGHFNLWSPVAHGNGIEAGWAEEHDIPSLHIVPESMKTSRIVRGMHNIIGTVAYVDFETDGLEQIDEFLGGVQAERLASLE